MNFHPDREVIRVGRFVAEFGEVEPCGGGRGAVACGAVFLKERVGAGEGWGSRPAGREEDGSRQNQFSHQPLPTKYGRSISRDFPGPQSGEVGTRLRGRWRQRGSDFAPEHLNSIYNLMESNLTGAPNTSDSTSAGFYLVDGVDGVGIARVDGDRERNSSGSWRYDPVLPAIQAGNRFRDFLALLKVGLSYTTFRLPQPRGHRGRRRSRLGEHGNHGGFRLPKLPHIWARDGVVDQRVVAARIIVALALEAGDHTGPVEARLDRHR